MSSSLLKKTRAMIDANRVIRLYLKGVVDSQSIKVKSAALVTAWFIIARSRRTTTRANGAREGRGDEAPPFVLIRPDVMCEAHFGNYPWKISMSRSIVIKWFKGCGLHLVKWFSSSHAQGCYSDVCRSKDLFHPLFVSDHSSDYVSVCVNSNVDFVEEIHEHKTSF